MASFYNNYYRYYRPYPQSMHKPYIDKEVSGLKSNETFSSGNAEKNINENINGNIKINVLNTGEGFSSKDKWQEKSSRSYSFGPINFKNPLFSDIEEPIFEILGIHLYLDDIIIIGLLFFLYNEGVQDEMLFIALILLLLG